MRGWLMVLVWSLSACGDTAPAEAPAPVEPVPSAPTPPAEAPPEDESGDEEELLPSYSEAELDAMDTPALETACYEGVTAACDRLGH